MHQNIHYCIIDRFITSRMTFSSIMLNRKSQVATNKINDGFKIFNFGGK